jgi:hypothetical protein
MRTVPEAFLLVNRNDDSRQVFVPGDEVPPEWIIPGEDDELTEETPTEEIPDDNPIGMLVEDNTVADIMAAVNAIEDPDERLSAAGWVLAEENLYEKPRKGLVDQLQALIGQ